jgi:hypothetical protein
MHNQSAPDVFLSALAARDFGRFAECLAPQAQARLLLPPGPEGWFSRASDFEVLDSDRAQIGGRNRLSWRFRLSRDGQSREVIEQVAFVSVGLDGISQIDLLCSGFLREEESVASSAIDVAASRGAR